MRPIKLDIDPANVVADGLADGNTSAGATVTLDGTLTSGGTFTSADGLGRQFVITDAGAHNQTTATYTFTGTDVDGRVKVASRAGPGSGASVELDEYFLTVTSVAIASPVAGSTVDIGTVDEVSGQTIPLNWRSENGANITVDVTGTLNFTVQETFVPIQDLDQIRLWVDITALASKTADTTSSSAAGATGVRLIYNSYTNTAETQIYLTQTDC
jgi:hypothetical protein